MSDDPEAHTMTFWEHLDELRGTLLRCVAGILLGGVWQI